MHTNLCMDICIHFFWVQQMHHIVNICLAFYKCTELFSKVIVSFHFPTSNKREFQFLYILPAFDTANLFHFSHSNNYVIITHCYLICIFLMMNAEHLFMYLTVIHVYSLLKCLLKSLLSLVSLV